MNFSNNSNSNNNGVIVALRPKPYSEFRYRWSAAIGLNSTSWTGTSFIYKKFWRSELFYVCQYHSK